MIVHDTSRRVVIRVGWRRSHLSHAVGDTLLQKAVKTAYWDATALALSLNYDALRVLLTVLWIGRLCATPETR